MNTEEKVIAFNFFDKTDGKFKEVYFKEWVGREPQFTEKKFAKKYWSNKQAKQDIEKLEKAVSKTSITLNIRLEENINS